MPYDIVIPGPVQRVISEELPESVAWAVIEFVNGDLLKFPRRVGRELQGDLEGVYSAHLSTFRVLYVIDDENCTVRLRRVMHRRDVYRFH
jgi:mRNA interferase RelE/StbE